MRMTSEGTRRFSSKATARAWGLEARRALSPAARDRLGRDIVARLIESPVYRASETVLTYVGSMPGELDTRPLIEDALHRGKSVLVPLTRPGGELGWSRLVRLADLVRSARGILEPRDSARDLVSPTSGLCVVPGVCFRPDGHRIGFGGGYYDRFLSGYGGMSVALCPDLLYRIDFPVEPHDQAVALIITESAIFPTGPVTFG